MTKDEAIEFLKKEGMIVKTNFMDDWKENSLVLLAGVVLGWILKTIF
jgi:hypothetical protein